MTKPYFALWQWRIKSYDKDVWTVTFDIEVLIKSSALLLFSNYGKYFTPIQPKKRRRKKRENATGATRFTCAMDFFQAICFFFTFRCILVSTFLRNTFSLSLGYIRHFFLFGMVISGLLSRHPIFYYERTRRVQQMSKSIPHQPTTTRPTPWVWARTDWITR